MDQIFLNLNLVSKIYKSRLEIQIDRKVFLPQYLYKTMSFLYLIERRLQKNAIANCYQGRALSYIHIFNLHFFNKY